MLPEKEEKELDELLETIEKLKSHYPQSEQQKAVEWLAVRLKKLNNELSIFTEELQRANELSAKLSERFE